MSGEFGTCGSGYFHTQIDNAADDLASGSEAMTRAWAPFFDAFRPVAKAICWVEASDSSPAHSIEETIARLPALKAALAQVEAFVEPYKVIARRAVEVAAAEQKEKGA